MDIGHLALLYGAICEAGGPACGMTGCGSTAACLVTFRYKHGSKIHCSTVSMRLIRETLTDQASFLCSLVAEILETLAAEQGEEAMVAAWQATGFDLTTFIPEVCLLT